MPSKFENIQTARETFNRMALSIVAPKARGTYEMSFISSCYGYVCQAFKANTHELYGTDRIVALGSEAGVNHVILVRGDTILADQLGKNNKYNSNTGVYSIISDEGEVSTTLQAQDHITISDFVAKCKNLAALQGTIYGLSPLKPPSI